MQKLLEYKGPGPLDIIVDYLGDKGLLNLQVVNHSTNRLLRDKKLRGWYYGSFYTKSRGRIQNISVLENTSGIDRSKIIGLNFEYSSPKTPFMNLKDLKLYGAGFGYHPWLADLPPHQITRLKCCWLRSEINVVHSILQNWTHIEDLDLEVSDFDLSQFAYIGNFSKLKKLQIRHFPAFDLSWLLKLLPKTLVSLSLVDQSFWYSDLGELAKFLNQCPNFTSLCLCGTMINDDDVEDFLKALDFTLLELDIRKTTTSYLSFKHWELWKSKVQNFTCLS